MRIKLLSVFVLMCLALFSFSQNKSGSINSGEGNSVITNPQLDSTKQRDRASVALRALRNGCVVIRIKTNDKSIEAYRKMGKNELADKIEDQRRLQNEKLYQAFKNYFTFCKVYFIYAKETQDFLSGRRDIFLNDKLEHDSSIVMKERFYVFCEYGATVSFSTKNPKEIYSDVGIYSGTYSRHEHEKILGQEPTSTTTSTASENAVFFSDSSFNQYFYPFPYSEDVYLDYYNSTVKTLDREMQRAYGRLVVNKDMRDAIKKEKKRQKEKLKQLKNEPVKSN